MTTDLPRITAVHAETATALRVAWKGGGEDVIELAGWIARASPVLAPLKDPAVFRAPALTDYGAVVVWGDPDGDLAIDAYHLSLIAAEQRPFTREDVVSWQAGIDFSNQEAADFLGIALSTWNTWKVGAVQVPTATAIACRATLRDPVLINAHYRPRKTGRPRKMG